MSYTAIHSLVYSNLVILVRVAVNPEPIPGTLDGMAVERIAQTGLFLGGERKTSKPYMSWNPIQAREEHTKLPAHSNPNSGSSRGSCLQFIFTKSSR